MPSLEALHLDGNRFSGSVTKLLESLRHAPLRRLGLGRNQFSGALSERAVAGLGTLETLRLGGNDLSGPFPASALAALPNLTNVSAWGNRFSGDVADFLRKAPRSLRTFDATANAFAGDLEATPELPDLAVSRRAGTKHHGPLAPPPPRRRGSSVDASWRRRRRGYFVETAVATRAFEAGLPSGSRTGPTPGRQPGAGRAAGAVGRPKLTQRAALVRGAGFGASDAVPARGELRRRVRGGSGAVPRPVPNSIRSRTGRDADSPR